MFWVLKLLEVLCNTDRKCALSVHAHTQIDHSKGFAVPLFTSKNNHPSSNIGRRILNKHPHCYPLPLLSNAVNTSSISPSCSSLILQFCAPHVFYTEEISAVLQHA
jgi:hypothetical protein